MSYRLCVVVRSQSPAYVILWIVFSTSLSSCFRTFGCFPPDRRADPRAKGARRLCAGGDAKHGGWGRRAGSSHGDGCGVGTCFCHRARGGCPGVLCVVSISSAPSANCEFLAFGGWLRFKDKNSMWWQEEQTGWILWNLNSTVSLAAYLNSATLFFLTVTVRLPTRHIIHAPSLLHSSLLNRRL